MKKALGMSGRRRAGNAVYHVFMVLLSLAMIYPFIWSLFSSFKAREQLYTDSPLNMIPHPFTLDNYKRAFEVLPFGNFLLNSVFLSIAIPICMIAIASITAYALTRLEFWGRNLLFLAFIATMMIPSHVTLIPNGSEPRGATVLGIDDDCRLLVRCDGDLAPTAFGSDEIRVIPELGTLA